MNSGDWAGRALTAVTDRVAVTAAEVGDRFPLYADPLDGRWTTTGRGSWTGGFWAGLLWLRARRTGAEADRAAAARCTDRLAPWAAADTATRGMIFWYGTAPALGTPAAAALRAEAARACLDAYDPRAGVVPWGAALGGPRLLARADAVPGLVPLLAGAGPRGPGVAAAHLHRHLDLCLGGVREVAPSARRAGPAGSGACSRRAGRKASYWTRSVFRPVRRERVPGVAGQAPLRGHPLGVGGAGRPGRPRPAWQFDAATGWQPREDPEPGWSRGEAWLLLAVADALLHPEVARHRPDRLDRAAEQLLLHTGALTGRLVPPDRASRPRGPLDTSAAAITAVALLKLSRSRTPLAGACAPRAEAILRRLAGAHLTGPGPGRPAGMLLDGCYDAAKGLAVRHELVWGDFFLALGLAALDGLVDLTRV